MAFSKKGDIDRERFELLRKKVRVKKKIIEELLKITLESQTRWSDMSQKVDDPRRFFSIKALGILISAFQCHLYSTWF